MEIKIAKKENAELILHFIKALAIAEGFPFEVTVTQEDLENNLLSSTSNAEAIIFYVNNKPCGFAVYYYTFSTTTGQRGLHLDDLYIEPAYQDQGFGKQVLVYLSHLAIENQCARFEWWALKTNDAAIKFYKNIGAHKLEEISVFRLDLQGILSLSDGEPISNQ
ncbi:GNAT family N-acetyltransferase [Agarivorans sp. Z349TD_8]|uniref:GNAT family N-acetyltransferase n=1 Tax=Agarivorans sp. Z349TD_8 TaxID=3421434 RepID=UPI003D7C3844